MQDIFPSTEIRSRFDRPLTIQHFGMPEFETILKKQDGMIFGLALNVWNRIVNGSAPPADPMVLSPIIASHFQGQRVSGQMLRQMEIVVRSKIIREISYTECKLEDTRVDEKIVGKLIVAHVYPNDLHIGDVNFQNPYKPLTGPNKKYHCQDYEGLGLLGTVMERIDGLAADCGADNITLTAADDDLVPLFTGYGFSLETNPLGHAARAMEKRVLRSATDKAE